ncbi:MAG: VCBS repeat-containing protein [Myxococcota bacterium]
MSALLTALAATATAAALAAADPAPSAGPSSAKAATPTRSPASAPAPPAAPASTPEPTLRPAPGAPAPAPLGPAWRRHAIDDRYLSPDGTKLGDFDGDGLQDVVTGWEGEGLTVVYRNPGPRLVRRAWPSVVVGATPAAEDAVFVDLDRDGALDVVTSSELAVERVFVHWAPAEPARRLVPQAWRQASFPAVDRVSQWMFAEPIELASPAGSVRGLVIGGKNDRRDRSAVVGLLVPGRDPAKADDYVWRPLTAVSWTMSIVVRDLDGDGDPDVLYSDKQGPSSGVFWLENPGADALAAHWPHHTITSGVESAMLLDVADLDRDGTPEIVVPIDHHPEGTAPKRRSIRILHRPAIGTRWSALDLPVPAATGQPKAVTAGDVDGDGRVDLVVTSTGAYDGQMGAYWLEPGAGPLRAEGWRVHRIAGPEGIKFDLVHLLDLDGDGDSDVLTSEEKQDERGLGVVWYENPSR